MLGHARKYKCCFVFSFVFFFFLKKESTEEIGKGERCGEMGYSMQRDQRAQKLDKKETYTQGTYAGLHRGYTIENSQGARRWWYSSCVWGEERVLEAEKVTGLWKGNR